MDNNSVRWLGLSSYEEKDAELFYGRENEIHELSEDIYSHTQTVVYGPSGVGKTSILRAGIFSLARKNGFLPVYIRLDEAGDVHYTRQIIDAIEAELALNGAEREVVVEVADHDPSLWEYFHANSFWDANNYPIVPMILIDQFEELFTLSKNQEWVEDFFVQLSDLCDGKVPLSIQTYLNKHQLRSPYLDRDDNFRIIISLREDFLARLEECSESIPSLKINRYSLQAMSGSQAMEVILKPGEGIVTEEVAKKIVDKLAYRPTTQSTHADNICVEPALLSLFCNELDKKRQQQKEKKITLSLLETFGDDIIQEFYNNTISGISQSSAEFLENVLLTKDGFRDNVSLNDALSSGLTEQELEHLKNNRLIRIEEWGGAKRIEFTHDVLCKVAKERRDNRELQRREEEARAQQAILEEQLKVRRKRNVLMSLLVLFLCLLIAGTYWAFFMKQVAYYENIVFCYEWPKGINELSSSEVKERPLSYRLEKRGYLNPHWGRLSAINGTMNFNEDNDFNKVFLASDVVDKRLIGTSLARKLSQVCQWEFVLDDSKKMVIQQKAYDRVGNLIYSFCYSVNDFENDKLVKCMGMYIDADGYPIQSFKNGANNVHIRLDNEGYRKSVEFFDAWGNRDKDKNYAYAYKWELGEDGRYLRKSVVDESGMNVYDRRSEATTKFEYKDGKLIKKINVDVRGEICVNKLGFAQQIYEYDDKGRMISESFYNEKGEPVSIKNKYGVVCHAIWYRYDDKGCVSLVGYYDENKKLMSNGCAYTEIKNNEIGKVERTLNYKANQALHLVNGVAGEEKKYEDKINATLVTSRTNIGAEKQPCVDTFGVATYQYGYDTRGNLIYTIYLDLNGDRVDSKDGFAEIRSEFNGQDKMLQTWHYSADGNLVMNPREGHSGIVCEYDEKGNLIRESFFDANKQPIMKEQKYHAITYEYDRFNNLTKSVYKDGEDKNVENQEIFVNEYDMFGNMVSSTCYASDEKTPIRSKEGWNKKEIYYDENKFPTETVYYDMLGYIINAPNKPYAIERLVNDRLGNPISRTYFDADMFPCQYRGSFKDSLVYDGMTLEKEVAMNQSGDTLHSTLYQYDEQKTLVAVSYEDKKGEPCAPFGYWKKEVVADSLGQKSVSYMKPNGKVIQTDTIGAGIDIATISLGKELPKYGTLRNENWIYEGYLLNGQPQGVGRFTWLNTGTYVEGTFNGWNVVVNTWENND